MIRIAVLTPDPADPSYRGQWPGVLERLTQALSAGARVVQVDAVLARVEAEQA